MNKLSRPRYLFLAIMAFSAVTYLGFCLTLHPVAKVALLDIDEQEYYHLAEELIQGKYEFDPRRTLGYVIVLALLQLVTFGNLMAIQLLVAVIFSLSAPLMYLLVRRITGNNLLAVTVAVFVIFWPPFIYYGTSLYSETLALPVFICLLILLPRGSVLTDKPDGGWRRCLLAGSLMGLCMLIRPMYLLFGPMAVLILFFEERQILVALRRSVLLTIGCCLVVLPWSVYISIQTGLPMLISYNGGETLSGGLNPVLLEKGYGTTYAPDGRQFWYGPGKWLTEQGSGYLSRDELKLPYAQRDKLLRQRTMDWVIKNPGSALKLETAKLLYMWGFYPFWNGTKQTLCGNVPIVACLILSVISLFRFRHYLRHLSRFWILPIFVSIVALISWGSWRFRQPGDLALLVFTGLLLWSLFVRVEKLVVRLKQV